MATSIHEEVRRGRMRFVALNAIIWIALLVGGTFAIFGLRSYGNAMIRSAELRADIDQAIEELSDGDLNTAQQTALKAIQPDATMVTPTMDALGADIGVLPRLAAAPESLDPSERAQALLVTGQREKADALLLNIKDTRSTAQLWKARTALQRGDILEADTAFRAYWDRRPRDREALAAAIAPQGETYKPSDRKSVADAMYRMIWSGLWDECFTAAHALGGAETNPQFALAVALEHDLADRKTEALKNYEAVLKKIPTHHLATLRVQALKEK